MSRQWKHDGSEPGSQELQKVLSLPSHQHHPVAKEKQKRAVLVHVFAWKGDIYLCLYIQSFLYKDTYSRSIGTTGSVVAISSRCSLRKNRMTFTMKLTNHNKNVLWVSYLSNYQTLAGCCLTYSQSSGACGSPFSRLASLTLTEVSGESSEG